MPTTLYFLNKEYGEPLKNRIKTDFNLDIDILSENGDIDSIKEIVSSIISTTR
jgi:hypothetical protein